MDTIINDLIFLHVACGGISLALGGLNMVRKKGDNIHRLIGKIFVFCMLSAATLALCLSVIHPNVFLFIIGVFTIYMVLTGWRYLNYKQNGKPQLFDYILTLTMFIFGLSFVALGVYQFSMGNGFAIVLAMLGFFSLLMVYRDSRNYGGKILYKNFWYLGHFQRMIGAYIAAFTAFLVNTKALGGTIIGWLLPAIVFVPLIVFWTRKYAVPIKTESELATERAE